jgi:hypothetical protein
MDSILEVREFRIEVTNSHLHGYTLILIRYFDIVDPDVSSPNINPIQSSFIASSYDRIVNFALERIQSADPDDHRQ